MAIVSTTAFHHICVASFPVETEQNGTMHIFLAMDEFTREVLGHDLLPEASFESWYEFLNRRVFIHPEISKREIVFYLRCQATEIVLLKKDSPQQHSYLSDDGRCGIVMREFVGDFLGKTIQ